MYTILYLNNLPQVPTELLKYSLDMNDSFFKGNPERTVIRNNKSYKAGLNTRQQLNNDLELWLKENIISEWNDAGYSRCIGPCQGPHIDRSRFFALQYIIETGGDDTCTVFYKPRTQKVDMEQGWFYINNYDQLEPFEHHFIKKGTWCLLNVRNHIHSVENIKNVRVSIQIGLMKDPLDEIFIKKIY